MKFQTPNPFPVKGEREMIDTNYDVLNFKSFIHDMNTNLIRECFKDVLHSYFESVLATSELKVLKRLATVETDIRFIGLWG